MVKYIFWFDDIDNEKYAEYDPVGGAIILFLNNFKKDVDEYKVFDTSEILLHVVAQVLIHEDIHQGIADCGLDTTGEQEHEVMESMAELLDPTISH